MSKRRLARASIFFALAMLIPTTIAWKLFSAGPITVVGNFSKTDIAQIKRAVHRSVIAALPPRHLKWLPYGIQKILPDFAHPITWIALMPDGSARAWYRVDAKDGAKMGMWYTGSEYRWGTAECRLTRGPEGWVVGGRIPTVVPVRPTTLTAPPPKIVTP